MKKVIRQLKDLRKLVEVDKAAYKQAIKEHRPFSEIKIIYLRLKEYEQLAEILLSGV